MNWCQQFVCCGCDDCARGNRDFSFPPLIPDAGKREWRFVFHLKEIRLSDLPQPLPLIKTICQNQASPAPKGLTEAWLLVQSFGARIDESFGFFTPGWNETPLKESGLGLGPSAERLPGRFDLARCCSVEIAEEDLNG